MKTTSSALESRLQSPASVSGAPVDTRLTCEGTVWRDALGPVYAVPVAGKLVGIMGTAAKAPYKCVG